MVDGFHVYIGEEEWLAFPKEKRERIKELLMEYYGIDPEVFIQIEEEEE